MILRFCPSLLLLLLLSSPLCAQGKGRDSLERRSSLSSVQEEFLEATTQLEEEEDAANLQAPRRDRVRQEVNDVMGNAMALTSGIGIDLYRPPMKDAATFDKPWVNVNMLLYVIELQAGFGKMDVDPTKLDLGGKFINVAGVKGQDVYGRNLYMGFNVPIPKIGFGNRGASSLLRGHLFLAGGFGAFTIWEKNKDFKSSLGYVAFSPGFRICNGIFSAEARLQGTLGLRMGDDYREYFKGAALYPVFTLRANGLFNKLVNDVKTIQTAYMKTTGGGSTTKTDIIHKGGNAYERTTTSSWRTQKLERGTSFFADMGAYWGIGPRISFTRPLAGYYAKPSFLVGGNAELRGGPFMAGFNVESGRVGHGSITEGKGDKKRKVDRDETYGRGSYNATNVFFDLGLDLRGGTGLARNAAAEAEAARATTFSSINVGYSFGYSVLGNQQFDDEAASTAYYLAKPPTDVNKKTDPREGKSGYFGGFFAGLEMGAVTFRIQAYRYRSAPLANNTYYTLAWRFLSRAGEK